MNTFCSRLIFFIAVAVIGSAQASAQNASSASSIVRKGADTKAPTSSSGVKVTDRMQQFYDESTKSDADAQWMKVVYRHLDLEKGANAALYYPEDVIDGQENLFRIIMRLVASGEIPVYEYLDGKEIFTPEYKVNVRDLLDRFHVLYTDAKGSTERNPKFIIEESDVPSNEVLSYYILERWEVDKRDNRMRTRVEAICPVLHRAGDFGGEAVRYPMFWVKMDVLRPYLTQQSIFVDDDNNLARYNYDDFFQIGLYEGEIYKTRNLRNLSMMQMYPDPDDLKKAQDSIQNYLVNYEKKMWVPSREEIIAAREEQERLAAGDTIAAREVKKTSSARSSRAKRATKPKSSKVKESKVKSSSSSSAVRSVRRTKR